MAFKKQLIKEKMNLDWDWFRSMSDERAYDYLINVYIPSQGHADMVAFIKLNFDPIPYFLWKFSNIGVIEGDFREAIKKKVTEEFGEWPDEKLA